MNVLEKYKEYCVKHGIEFHLNENVGSYDKSTLFCPAGMQQFKPFFSNIGFNGTIANSQSCIRMNDLQEIGDSTHLLYFNMLGLFSFREMQIDEAIRFWIDFLSEIGLKPDYVTIHPSKKHLKKWTSTYEMLRIPVVEDEECTWSDGEIGGFCTEFFIYKDGEPVEVGNIVNPLGTCIDAGFGLERLEMFVNGKTIDKESTLKETIMKIIDSGYKPSANKQGYVLRKLLLELYNIGGTIDHEFFVKEVKRQEKNKSKYYKLREKHADKSDEWWWDTHGIKLKDYE
jgi:alanyl-tRNA synthetase